MSEMSKRQSWAIRCASGLDVRGITFSYEDASRIIGFLNDPEKFSSAVRSLQAQGAKGTPKAFKPYRKNKPVKVTKGARKPINNKDRAHQELYDRAVKAAEASVAEMTAPVPMVVAEHTNPLDDNSPIKKVYAPAMGGVCGFSWIVVKDSRTSFAKWLVKNEKGRSSDYERGVIIWGRDNKYNGQSMETKQAWTRGFVSVLREAGINAQTYNRMD